MADALSTLEVSVRWADEVRDVHRLTETRHFLFARGEGHLLVQESLREDAASEAVSSTTTQSFSAQHTTMLGQPDRVRVPRARRVTTRPDERYILLKKYEGIITSRAEQSFTARLSENASDYPVLEAEFDLEELSETDRALAVEGAPLVWTIGYGYEGNTRKRESTIYLRRLPPWSDKEIEQSRSAAEELTRGIQWE